jgi:hypothetical protein
MCQFFAASTTQGLVKISGAMYKHLRADWSEPNGHPVLAQWYGPSGQCGIAVRNALAHSQIHQEQLPAVQDVLAVEAGTPTALYDRPGAPPVAVSGNRLVQRAPLTAAFSTRSGNLLRIGLQACSRRLNKGTIHEGE